MKNYPEIAIQQQPNRYACYPTCISILTSIPLEKLFEILGHDGSDNDGFRYDEVALATLILGWSLICLSEYNFSSLTQILNDNNLTYRMILSIKRYNHYHAVAWDGKSEHIIDPLKNNNLVRLDKIKHKIVTAEILVPIENRKINFLNTRQFKDL